MAPDYRNIANLVELMAWADESMDKMALLQRELPVTSPELFQVIGNVLDDKGSTLEEREIYLAALVATSIQKLSAP